MDMTCAHALLDSTMNQLVGSRPCHPDLYLLCEDDPCIIKARRELEMKVSEKDEAGRATSNSLSGLLRKGGAVTSSSAKSCKGKWFNKKRGDKWKMVHATFFEKMGEDCFLFVLACFTQISPGP
jgi:hypothetical protein